MADPDHASQEAYTGVQARRRCSGLLQVNVFRTVFAPQRLQSNSSALKYFNSIVVTVSTVIAFLLLRWKVIVKPNTVERQSF